jgi:hypothetical protein
MACYELYQKHNDKTANSKIHIFLTNPAMVYAKSTYEKLTMIRPKKD